jgi:hypothetical protein
MIFFTGLHMPNHAKYFKKSFISINRIEHRKSDFEVKDWILDSGAFSRITTGKGHMPINDYADQIKRWSSCGNLLAAVCQDYMCEDFVCDITGLTVGDHQAMTINNFNKLSELVDTAHVMPVLQGYEPEEYVEHIDAYDSLLEQNTWCGVGSVCKRNSSVESIINVLEAIKNKRPDLRLHGFGLKQTSLRNSRIRDLLYSADSMAWSYAARKRGGNPNDYREAIKFSDKIDNQQIQLEVFK